MQGLIDIYLAAAQPVQYVRSNLIHQKKTFKKGLVGLRLPLGEVKFNQTFLQLWLWLLVLLPAQTDLLLLQPCFTSVFWKLE